MKLSELVGKVRAGAFMAVGEYRMSRKEILNWRNKADGKPMSAPVLRHTVEVGDRSVAISERVPDNAELEDIVVPWVKGQHVVVHLDELTATKGQFSCRGRLEELQDDGVAGPASTVSPAGRSGK